VYSLLQSKKITQVACGSAHTLAWSTNKPVSASRLPVSTPLEYDLVRDFQLPALRNRLVLLHHFSELFCPGVAMFPIDGEGSLDKLRGILVSSTKEATFRKVSIHCLKMNQYSASILFVCSGWHILGLGVIVCLGENGNVHRALVGDMKE